jgi:hypothetical protein
MLHLTAECPLHFSTTKSVSQASTCFFSKATWVALSTGPRLLLRWSCALMVLMAPLMDVPTMVAVALCHRHAAVMLMPVHQLVRTTILRRVLNLPGTVPC